MSSIGDILQKYKVQIQENKSERLRMANIFTEISGVNFSEKDIVFETGRLTLRSHPAKRQIAFIRKVEILQAIQSEFPDKRIHNIF